MDGMKRFKNTLKVIVRNVSIMPIFLPFALNLMGNVTFEISDVIQLSK